MSRSAREGVKTGSTALCALIENKQKLYIAWLGDSQGILVRNGQIIELTEPHKPDREDEKLRIEQQGGVVTCYDTWRVNGTLAVSRAIGDPEHKPYVISEPEIKEIVLDGSEDFLILGCDGLWDQISPEEAATLVYQYLCENGQDDVVSAAENVASYLCTQAKEEGSSDNITTIVVFFKELSKLLTTSYIPYQPKLKNGQHNGAQFQQFAQEWNGNQFFNFSNQFKNFDQSSGLNSFSLSSSNGDLPTPPIDDLNQAKISIDLTDSKNEINETENDNDSSNLYESNPFSDYSTSPNSNSNMMMQQDNAHAQAQLTGVSIGESDLKVTSESENEILGHENELEIAHDKHVFHSSNVLTHSEFDTASNASLSNISTSFHFNSGFNFNSNSNQNIICSTPLQLPTIDQEQESNLIQNQQSYPFQQQNNQQVISNQIEGQEIITKMSNLYDIDEQFKPTPNSVKMEDPSLNQTPVKKTPVNQPPVNQPPVNQPQINKSSIELDHSNDTDEFFSFVQSERPSDVNQLHQVEQSPASDFEVNVNEQQQNWGMGFASAVGVETIQAEVVVHEVKHDDWSKDYRQPIASIDKDESTMELSFDNTKEVTSKMIDDSTAFSPLPNDKQEHLLGSKVDDGDSFGFENLNIKDQHVTPESDVKPEENPVPLSRARNEILDHSNQEFCFEQQIVSHKLSDVSTDLTATSGSVSLDYSSSQIGDEHILNQSIYEPEPMILSSSGEPSGKKEEVQQEQINQNQVINDSNDLLNYNDSVTTAPVTEPIVKSEKLEAESDVKPDDKSDVKPVTITSAKITKPSVADSADKPTTKQTTKQTTKPTTKTVGTTKPTSTLSSKSAGTKPLTTKPAVSSVASRTTTTRTTAPTKPLARKPLATSTTTTSTATSRVTSTTGAAPKKVTSTISSRITASKATTASAAAKAVPAKAAPSKPSVTATRPAPRVAAVKPSTVPAARTAPARPSATATTAVQKTLPSRPAPRPAPSKPMQAKTNGDSAAPQPKKGPILTRTAALRLAKAQADAKSAEAKPEQNGTTTAKSTTTKLMTSKAPAKTAGALKLNGRTAPASGASK